MLKGVVVGGAERRAARKGRAVVAKTKTRTRKMGREVGVGVGVNTARGRRAGMGRSFTRRCRWFRGETGAGLEDRGEEAFAVSVHFGREEGGREEGGTGGCQFSGLRDHHEVKCVWNMWADKRGAMHSFIQWL